MYQVQDFDETLQCAAAVAIAHYVMRHSVEECLTFDEEGKETQLETATKDSLMNIAQRDWGISIKHCRLTDFCTHTVYRIITDSPGSANVIPYEIEE